MHLRKRLRADESKMIHLQQYMNMFSSCGWLIDRNVEGFLCCYASPATPQGQRCYCMDAVYLNKEIDGTHVEMGSGNILSEPH